MSAKIFIDTNVFVYSIDSDPPEDLQDGFHLDGMTVENPF